MEDVIAQGAGNPYAMQVSFFKDHRITEGIIRRAESTTLPQKPFHVLIYRYKSVNIALSRGRVQSTICERGPSDTW